MWWQPNVLFYQYSFRQLIFMRCLFLKSLKDAVICCILCVGFQGNRTVTSWLRGRVNAGTQLSEFPGYGLILSYCLSAYRWCSTPSPLNAKFTGLGFSFCFSPVTEPQGTEATRISSIQSPTIWILHPSKFCLCIWGHLRWPSSHVGSH